MHTNQPIVVKRSPPLKQSEKISQLSNSIAKGNSWADNLRVEFKHNYDHSKCDGEDLLVNKTEMKAQRLQS